MKKYIKIETGAYRGEDQSGRVFPMVKEYQEYTGSKQGGRAEAQQYSGERKLLGIAIMHKSNLVPVFDEESAKEISKMRRN